MRTKDVSDTLIGGAEIAISAVFPPAAPLVALEKLLREQAPKLRGDNDPAKKLAGIYLDTFGQAVEECWRTDKNPVAGKWSYGDFKIAAEDLAKKYQLPATDGRSFVYDWLYVVLDAMLKKEKACPKDKALEFMRFLTEEWKKRFDLRAMDPRIAEKALHEFDWARYKFCLRLLPYQEIMNKEDLGGIQAIYVQPKAKTLDKDGKPEGRATSLKKLVRDGLDFEKKTKPQLVLGLPGMGKTSFSKMFVAELAEDRPEVYPVLVRLRVLKTRIKPGTPWLQALRDAPSLTDGSEPLKLTDDDMREKHIVMILDGLDELAIGGTHGDAVSDLFKEALSRYQEVESFCAVVTSRPLQMLESQEQRAVTEPHYGVQLLTSQERGALVDKLKKGKVLKATKKAFLDWVAEVDKHNKPEEHMGGQPLLLFLLADCFSQFTRGQRKALKDNPKRAHIYQLIVEKTVERAHDNEDNVRHYEDAGLETHKEVRQVLGEIALVLHHLGREYSQRDEIHQYLKGVAKSHLPPTFTGDAGALHKVLLSFYVAEHRPQEGEAPTAGAVEFIHKSIAEYLAADAVFRRLGEACQDRRPERFAEDFLDIFGPQGIDDQMHWFLVELFQDDESGLGERLLEPLQTFVDGVLSMQWLNSNLAHVVSTKHVSARGGGANMGDPLGFETWAGLAALRLFAILQEARKDGGELPYIVRLDEPAGVFSSFLHRTQGTGLGRRLIVAPAEANLSVAQLARANLFVADLSGANLSGANLYVANLYVADLSEANLSGAYLSGANLSGAYLSEANLSGADLSGANLSEANLDGANLSGAKLSGAKLSGAVLERAYLDGVFLRFDVDGESRQYDDKEARALIKKHFPTAKI